MAYQMNVPRMLEVLRIGQEKLSDKGIRSADKRVAPLLQQTSMPRQEIIDHLVSTFGETVDLKPGLLTGEERAGAEQRAVERFDTDAWRYILP
jgi:lipoate-protein ligase A